MTMGKAPRSGLAQQEVSGSVALVLAVILTVMLQVSDGFATPWSLRLLALAIVLAIAMVSFPGLEERWSLARYHRALAAGVIILTFGLLVSRLPALYLRLESYSDLVPFLSLSAAAAVISGFCLSKATPWAGVLTLPVLSIALGCWIIHDVPRPSIDVWVFHQEALKTLLSGENPYSMSIPNIYGPDWDYGPGVLQGDRVMTGYPYSPLSLIVNLPAYLLFGDYRYTNVLAVGISGLLILLRRTPLSLAAGVLLLFNPRLFFLIEQGWNDPLVLLGLSIVVTAYGAQPRVQGATFGMLLAAKQYALIYLPLMPLLREGRRPTRLTKLAMWAGGVLALTHLIPFFVDPRAAWRSMYGLYLGQKPRMDSLSLAPWLSAHGFPAARSLSGLGVLAAWAIGWWKLPSTVASLAGVFVLVTLLFFGLSARQAFLNYHFLAMAACCWAATLSSQD